MFEEPLLLATLSPLLLDETACVVDALSFPLALLVLDTGTEVMSDGDGGRAYSSVQRFAVRSCCAR